MKLFSMHSTISLLAQLYAFWSRIFPCSAREAKPWLPCLRFSRFTVLVHKTDSVGAGAVPNDLLGPTKEVCVTFWNDPSLWHILVRNQPKSSELSQTPELSRVWPHITSLSLSLFTTFWTHYIPTISSFYMLRNHTLYFCEFKTVMSP